MEEKTKPILESLETIRCNLNETHERICQLQNVISRITLPEPESPECTQPSKDTPWEQKAIEQKLNYLSALSYNVDARLRDAVARLNNIV